jgi:hypothetical protein
MPHIGDIIGGLKRTMFPPNDRSGITKKRTRPAKTNLFERRFRVSS